MSKKQLWLDLTAKDLKSSNMAPNPRLTKATADKQREAKNETLVESTFNNIIDYYSDPEALSTALKEAKQKTKNLERDRLKLTDAISRRDAFITSAEARISTLLSLVREEEERNSKARPKEVGTSDIPVELHTTSVVDAIKILIHTPNGYQRTEERIMELGVEIEKTRMLVKMLEGVQGLSAAGGIKRPRNDAVKKKSESKKPKIS